MNNTGNEFGENKLIDTLKDNKNKSSNEILDNIKDSIMEFTKDTAQYDDITLIILKKV